MSGISIGQSIVNYAENFIGQTDGRIFNAAHTAEKWCMDFASSAWAHITGAPHFSSCREAQGWAQQHGKWHAYGDGYSPKAGDIILYNWNRDGLADHAGIVRGADSSGVYTVEGNTRIPGSKNGVANKHRPWNNQILGFISAPGSGDNTNFGEYRNLYGDTMPNQGFDSAQNLEQLLNQINNLIGNFTQGNSETPASSLMRISSGFEQMLGGGFFENLLGGFQNLLAPGLGTALLPFETNFEDKFKQLLGFGAQNNGGISNPPESGLNFNKSGPKFRMPTNGSKKQLVQMARQKANKYNIPPDLFCRLVDTESSWDQNSTSSKGAIGLTQLLPSTAQELGYSKDELFSSPEKQLDAGAQYLSQQFHRFKDWRLAAAAYNAGPGAVQKSLRKNGDIPPYKETRAYVAKVLGADFNS